jgi:hypothetical protein
MSFEEEFDKNMRQKVEDGKYPFDENNWIRVSRMLDVERKAERMALIRKFYIPAALVLLLGLSGFFVYNNLTGEPQAAGKIVAATVPAPVTVPSEIAANKETAEVAASPAPATKNTVREINANPVSKKVVVKSGPAQKNIVNSNAEKSIPAQDSKSNNGTSSSQSPDIRTNENNSNGYQEPVANITSDRSSSNSQQAADSEENKTLNNREASGIVSSSENPASAEEIVSADYLASLNAQIPYQMVDPNLNPTFGQYKKPKDEDYYSKSKKAKMHYLNAEAGTSYMLGWQANGGQDAKGFNWFGGINYGFYLSKKLSIGLGLQAYNIGNIDKAFFDNERKNYSFGSSSSYTIITTHDLYYAAVPFRISYDLNANNRFGVGVNGAWLMTAKNTVETYDDLDNAKINDVKTKNTGVYQGVKDKNVMLSVFYRSQITGRIGINAEFTYGMTDIFENNSRHTATQKPIAFRVGLQYTLFDK